MLCFYTVSTCSALDGHQEMPMTQKFLFVLIVILWTVEKYQEMEVILWYAWPVDPVAPWMSLHLQFVIICDFLLCLLQNIGRKSLKLHKLVELLSDAEDLCLW